MLKCSVLFVSLLTSSIFVNGYRMSTTVKRTSYRYRIYQMTICTYIVFGSLWLHENEFIAFCFDCAFTLLYLLYAGVRVATSSV